MPDTYAEGATEGYVEIISMAAAASETQHLALAAKHTTAGVPLSCDLVRQHFYPSGGADEALGRGSQGGTTRRLCVLWLLYG